MKNPLLRNNTLTVITTPDILSDSVWLILRTLYPCICLQQRRKIIQTRGNVNVWIRKNVHVYIKRGKRDYMNTKEYRLLAQVSVYDLCIPSFLYVNDHLWPCILDAGITGMADHENVRSVASLLLIMKVSFFLSVTKNVSYNPPEITTSKRHDNNTR